jgi:hypothetical protein
LFSRYKSWSWWWRRKDPCWHVNKDDPCRSNFSGSSIQTTTIWTLEPENFFKCLEHQVLQGFGAVNRFPIYFALCFCEFFAGRPKKRSLNLFYVICDAQRDIEQS